MKNYRTAMGKTIDMAALEAKNEHTRAVGNMKVNARGDIIDPHGQIIVPVTERVAKTYSETVGNKSANAVRRPTSARAPLTTEEDLEIEKIKQQEIKGKR
jgi:hypothetical protein